MPRYVTKAWIADDCDYDARQPVPRLEIIASDEAVSTGLLDSNGDPVYRVRDPVGFIRREG